MTDTSPQKLPLARLRDVQGAAHTPGPWRFKGVFSGSHTPRRAEIRAPSGHREICAVYWHIVDGDHDTAEANARLIAAAPDLLAALEGLLEHAKEQIPNGLRDDETFEAARAAIAKAEGQQ